MDRAGAHETPARAEPSHGHDEGHDHDDAHEHRHDRHEHGRRAGSSGHAQGHAHSHAELRATPMRRLVWAFAITSAFMIVEAAVGWISGSLALVADAGHMLADSVALALAIFAQRIAAGTRTRAQTYGFRRAEVLAAFANGIALVLIALWIFFEAIQRWREPHPIRGWAMMLTAVLGLAINLGSAAVLVGGKGGQNANTRAALAHVLSDAIGSAGAIVAGILVLTLGWTRADAGVSVVIAVLILVGSWRLVRDTAQVLMEGTPASVDLKEVERTLRDVPGVVDFHDLHVWSISDGFDVLTVHVIVDKGHHGIDVVSAVSRRLRERHGLDHVTIQPEVAHEEALVQIKRGPSATPS